MSLLPIAANIRARQVLSRSSSRVRSPGSLTGAVVLRSQTALTGSDRPGTIPAAGAGTPPPARVKLAVYQAARLPAFRASRPALARPERERQRERRPGRRGGGACGPAGRLDGLVISHKSNGDRCPGSGQVPGEDLAVASWAPIIKGLTPHGLRHGLKVWMDEDQIADVLKSERLGHDEPGMRGVYGHVSPAMREELKAALQARWEESLRQRAALSPVSAVQLLNRLLAGIRPASKPVRSPLAPRIGHRERRNANRR